LLAETPFARPNAIAISAVFSTVTSTPPFFTNATRLFTPFQPSPGRMSSVWSIPMFGVSSVFFQGIGFRHIGRPDKIVCGLPLVGGKRITSYFALRLGSFAASCTLMYEYGMWRKSNA
jgi:hypothetical protein